jgi:acetyl esterase/lipase
VLLGDGGRAPRSPAAIAGRRDFLEAYVGHLADRTVPDVSPVVGDLRGLPPILPIVGRADVLLEDNLAMAARLCAAGGPVDLEIYPESPHGFTGHPTSMARAALAGRVAADRSAAAASPGSPAVPPLRRHPATCGADEARHAPAGGYRTSIRRTADQAPGVPEASTARTRHHIRVAGRTLDE